MLDGHFSVYKCHKKSSIILSSPFDGSKNASSAAAEQHAWTFVDPWGPTVLGVARSFIPCFQYLLSAILK